MSESEIDLSQFQEARDRFASLVAEIRPDLHRYCARMTGSVIEGEDVVQDTLARAFYELSELKEPPKLRAWLFRIAHNRALDFLRRYDRRMGEPWDERLDELADERPEPDEALSRADAVRTAVARFVDLPPLQRSCVVLKDVLDSSLEEIAALLSMNVGAVKSALHRGRARLHTLTLVPDEAHASRPATPIVKRYAELFNARDWDGVRAMLVNEVRLDVVGAAKRAGREKVGIYFTNYARRQGWHMIPAHLEGREGLAVVTHAADRHVHSFIELTIGEDGIAGIRDFHHVAYFMQDARISLASETL
jgi:RNA polymerase sigma factor (sigma-70 family)